MQGPLVLDSMDSGPWRAVRTAPCSVRRREAAQQTPYDVHISVFDVENSPLSISFCRERRKRQLQTRLSILILSFCWKGQGFVKEERIGVDMQRRQRTEEEKESSDTVAVAGISK